MENQKQDKASSQKPDLESRNQLRVGKVLAPHNARLRAVTLIKGVKECDFLKYLFFQKKNEIKCKQ